MDSRERIITKSFKSKEECVTFVNEILSKLDLGDTLQLTMIIQPERYEVSYVSTATTTYSGLSSEMMSELLDAS